MGDGLRGGRSVGCRGGSRGGYRSGGGGGTVEQRCVVVDALLFESFSEAIDVDRKVHSMNRKVLRRDSAQLTPRNRQ